MGDRSAFMMNSAGSERLHVFANLSHPVCDTVLCDNRWWYSGMQRAKSCEIEAFGVRKCCAAVDFGKTTRSHSLFARRIGDNRLELSVSTGSFHRRDSLRNPRLPPPPPPLSGVCFGVSTGRYARSCPLLSSALDGRGRRADRRQFALCLD